MRPFSMFIVPLALCGATSAFAITPSEMMRNSLLSRPAVSAVLLSPQVSGLAAMDHGKAAQDVVRLAQLQAAVTPADASPARSVPADTKATPPAAVSLPPDELPTRSDVGGPRLASNEVPAVAPMADSTEMGRTTTKLDAFADSTLPPLVQSSSAMALASDAAMMTPQDSMGPVTQTQLASLDIAYIPVTPAPIVAPETAVTPSIVRRKPEERALVQPKTVTLRRPDYTPPPPTVTLRKLPVARPVRAAVGSEHVSRPHVARVKTTRPAEFASTSVPESAQIAGLRAMERMQ